MSGEWIEIAKNVSKEKPYSPDALYWSAKQVWENYHGDKAATEAVLKHLCDYASSHGVEVRTVCKYSNGGYNFPGSYLYEIAKSDEAWNTFKKEVEKAFVADKNRIFIWLKKLFNIK